MQEIIDWDPSFSLLEVVTQKECFFCFIWVLKVSTTLTVGGLFSLRLLPLMIELSFCAHSGYSTRDQMARGCLLEVLQNYMQNKSQEIEKKIKHKDVIGAVPIMLCQNPSWIMGFRIYGEGRTQISLSSPATRGSWPRIQDRQGLY